MDPERKEKLDEICFEVSVKDDQTKAEKWNLQFKKGLQDYNVKYGHCELLCAVDCLTFILNTPSNTLPCSLTALQAKCQKVTALTCN
jgi:hypothetical protein